MSTRKKPRQRPSDFQDPPLRLDLGPFNSDTLTIIVAETGHPVVSIAPDRQAKWLVALNDQAIWLDCCRAQAQRPLRSEDRKFLFSIRTYATKLLDLMPISMDDAEVQHSDGGRPLEPYVNLDLEREMVQESAYRPGEGNCPEPEGANVPHGVRRLLLDHVYDALETRRCRQHEGKAEPIDWNEVGFAEDVLLLIPALLDLLVDAAKAAKAVDSATDHGDSPEYKFVAGLASIYSDMFNRTPGISRNEKTNKPGGPFLRFLNACFCVVKDAPADETLAKWIGKIKRGRPN